MSRIMKARYFPDDNILTATFKKKSSYAWKSIIHGIDILKRGMRFVIGNANLVNMWIDPWIIDHPPRPPCSIAGHVLEGKVREYFSEDGNSWNEQKLRNHVVTEDV